MPRDFEVYLEDIRDAIGKIRRYTKGLSREAFENDEKTVDAVVRNLQIIGEAVKMIPESVRQAHATIEWKKIAGLRDIWHISISELTSRLSGTFLRINFRRWKKRSTKS